jgi:hypothetical protein
MIEPDEQGAEATLNALDGLLAVVFPILEAAAARVNELEDEAADVWLNPCLFRFYAKKGLEERQFEVVDEGVERMEHEVLANNGLLLRYGRRDIRIRKADHGAIPAATSQTLRDFYEQDSLFGQAVETQRLLLLWDTRDGAFELTLACPKNGSGAPHWKASVPHPAEIHVAAEGAAEEDFDLPMQLRDAIDDEQ